MDEKIAQKQGKQASSDWNGEVTAREIAKKARAQRVAVSNTVGEVL